MIRFDDRRFDRIITGFLKSGFSNHELDGGSYEQRSSRREAIGTEF